MADIALQRIGITAYGNSNNNPAFSNHAADASTDGVGWLFQAENANAITHLGFRYGARTGTPPTYIIGLESSVVSTGFPDGTVLGGGSPASATFTPPASTAWDGTWQWVALANSYTPTRGQLLIATIRYSSGTVDGSNNSTFTTHVSGFDGGAFYTEPYALRLTAGTWAKQAAVPVFGIRTATERYGNPIETLYNTRSASTVGHRQALAFKMPSGSCTSFTVRGMRFSGSTANATGKNPVLGLWSDSALLQSYTLDSDVSPFASTPWAVREWMFADSSLATLSADTWYYAGMQVADAANGGVLINGIQHDSADEITATPGGANFVFATHDGSSWTRDATIRPLVQLILGDMTGGSGGSPRFGLAGGGPSFRGVV